MNPDGTFNAERYNGMLEELQEASKVLQDHARTGPVGPEAMRVVAAAQNIVNALTPTGLKVLMDGFEGHSIGIMHTAMKMGVFQGVPQDSSITTIELSKKLNVNEDLLHRIMRALVTKGYFKEVDVRTYEHTTPSTFMTNTQLAAMIEHLCDDTITSSANMHNYFAKNNWQNPSGLEDCPFTHLFGKSIWDIYKEQPERWKTFDTGMMGVHEDLTRQLSAFDFDRLKTDYKGDNEVAIVDIGGGRGQACRAYRKHYPQLKDLRMVVQDLPLVIDGVPEAERSNDIEFQAHNFFTPQPIKKARAYYFSRILHDWNDDKCREILKQITDAMDENSRILVRDIVIPDKGATRYMALFDINMMTIGSLERTESQWKSLLDSAGLTVESITPAKDAADVSVIEAKLKN